MMVDLSVITVTHERQVILLEKLATLRTQSLEPARFEWVLLFNGGGGAERFRDIETPFCIKVLEAPTQHPPGLARNICVRQAKGETLYFSDDDCLLEKDVLARHLAAQRERPCAAIGSIRYESERVSVWRPQKVNYWNVNGANTSLSRAGFEAVGGFEEELEGYGGEDILLGYQLKKRGLSFVALPEAQVRHLGPDPATGHDPAKARSAGRNARAIAAKHPELAFRLGVHPLLLWGKRVLTSAPLRPVWRSLNEASFTYERAYLEGALEHKGDHHVTNR